MNADDVKKYFTVKEVSERWGISTSSIKRMCKSGVLQSLKIFTSNQAQFLIPIDWLENFEIKNTSGGFGIEILKRKKQTV
ncbi:MAG: helix-turn-helix domain-containing protein [Bacteroidetes bacterium]|nr:helix-turn-helix domain-containing protein [Bacteroidota bacterium]